MCLTHSTGSSNFWFIEPDQKMHIHFDPGTHFSYSGEGMILLQFAIEHGRKAQGLGLDVGDLTKVNFDRLGMTRTSLTFRNGQDPDVADGWNDQGQPQPHEKRSKVRAAGSMNTTISYFAKFTAAMTGRQRPERSRQRRHDRPATAHRHRAPFPALSAGPAGGRTTEGPQRGAGRNRL